MKRIELLPLGTIDRRQVSRLATSLAASLGMECELMAPLVDIAAAFNPSRGQYASTELLARMSRIVSVDTWRLLGIASVDLYIPILTFVFGEAQLQGPCAVVSTVRLGQEFYGLPADEELLHNRLLKESVHELGHTFSLTHCEDVECVMAPSHAVEWIDLKSSRFCSKCAAAAQYGKEAGACTRCDEASTRSRT
jgi:archaemetzincin